MYESFTQNDEEFEEEALVENNPLQAMQDIINSGSAHPWSRKLYSTPKKYFCLDKFHLLRSLEPATVHGAAKS